MRPCTIRKARASDAADIRRLVRELAAGDGETSPITVRTVISYLKNPSCRIFVAEEAGTILAMASISIRPSLFHAGKSCVIEELVVSVEHRGRGIGGDLVSRAVQEAKKAGCAEISVSTEKKNKPAIALYKSRGMKEEYLYLEKHF
jgi:ribosomal protein S18 acetylase RimI-like enzyme